LRELGELEAAVAAFTDVADTLTDRSAPPERIALAYEEAGQTLARLDGREAEAADRFAAAAERYDGVDRARALRLRGAMLFLVDGEEKHALDVLAEARAVLDALPHDDPAVIRERARTAF